MPWWDPLIDDGDEVDEHPPEPHTFRKPSMGFRPAVREKLKLRLGLFGPSGSGKTYTALRLAHALAEGGKIAVVDTEHRSAEKYVGEENPDGGKFAFDVDCFEDFHPRRFIDAIHSAQREGYAVLILDSLSHCWEGSGGVLELVDQAADRAKTKNSFTAWRDVTPLHRELIESMLSAKLHIIATCRVKQEYVLEEDDRGKKTPRKVGMKPIQRDGMEYEFDVVADVDAAKVLITKTRCAAIHDKVYRQPGRDLAEPLMRWLGAGVAPAPTPTVDPRVETLRTRLMAAIKAGHTTRELAAELVVRHGARSVADLSPEGLTGLEAEVVELERLEAAGPKGDSSAAPAPWDQTSPATASIPDLEGADPSWAPECAEAESLLTVLVGPRVRLSYGELARFCEGNQRSRPARMSAEQRFRLGAWLVAGDDSTGSGAAIVHAWLRANPASAAA